MSFKSILIRIAIFLVSIWAMLLLLSGCGVRYLDREVPVEVLRKEYITNIDTFVRVQLDTVSAINIVQIPTDSSFLSNKYCSSYAWVDSSGYLKHTLVVRDTAILVETKYKIKEIYIEKPKYLNKYIEVYKQTLYQKILSKLGYLSIAVIFIALLKFKSKL